MGIKKLSKDFLFYGILDSLKRSTGIILIPIYTRVFSQAEYGTFDIIIITGSIFCVLADLQFVAGFSRFFYLYRDKGEDKKFVGTSIISRLITGILVPSIFLLLGFNDLIKVDFIPSFSENIYAWLFIGLNIPLMLTFNILLLHARMLRKKFCFALGTLSDFLVMCFSSVFFALIIKSGISGIVFSIVLGKVVGLTFMLFFLRNKILLSFDFGIFKKLIKYTIPLIPAWWLAFASTYICKFFIFGELGPDKNAILAVCMKFTNIAGIFSIAFQMAWLPLAMEKISNADKNDFYRRSLNLFMSGQIISIFLLTSFMGFILMIMVPESYHSAKYFFPLFGIGSMLSGCSNNLQLGNHIAEKTYWILISSVICICINIFILIIFIKCYGIVAAGIGWIISYSIKNIIAYFSAQKNHYINYDIRTFLLTFIGSTLLLLMIYCNYRLYISDIIFTFCSIVLGMILSFFILGQKEFQRIKVVLKNLMKTKIAK